MMIVRIVLGLDHDQPLLECHMPRKELIVKIQEARQSKVITYITSTRPNLEVQMAMDSIRKIYEHLTILGRRLEKVDLFLMSNGGDGTVPWKLVTLIREYAKKFAVIVPYRAFSAATLTALGADEIVMHPMGMLGPTDPTVANGFNPVDPQGRKVGISVEDVTAYLALIKEDAGIQHEDELVTAFNQLAAQVHPLALGNVKRSLSQSKMMATKLLSLHHNADDNHKIKTIVDSLTSKLYYHGHPINRKEAKDQIGLKKVIEPNDEQEQDIWNLYLDYETELQLETPFDPLQELVVANQGAGPGPITTGEKAVKLVCIESETREDYLEFKYRINGAVNVDGTTTAQTIQLGRNWKTV